MILTDKKGFTLIEMVIYITIIAGFLASTVFFAVRVVENSQRARVQMEVQQNGRIAMLRMVREIRAATDLNTGSSTFDSHPGVLSIENDNAGKDPTLFDLSSGVLQISQGVNGPYDLTTDEVSVTNLVFKDRSVSNRVKIIQIQMTIEWANAGSIAYEVSQSLQSTAVIRVQSD